MHKEPNKIILALDNNIDDGMDLVEKIESNREIVEMIYGYKVGSLWILEEGLEVVQDLYGIVDDHVVILDMQKWPTDLPEFVRKQVDKVVSTDAVDELIACPMGGGRKSLESFVIGCKEGGIRPLCVLEMTHPDSDSYLKHGAWIDILHDAATFGIDGFVIPSTKEPKQEIKIYLNTECPKFTYDLYTTGFEAQEGSLVTMIKFGVSRYIIGRGIYEAKDPEQTIINIYNEINGI